MRCRKQSSELIKRFPFFRRNPEMPCTQCYGRDHSNADCPAVICFQCRKTGHMGFACPKPNDQRALVCWTCKQPDHKRYDKKCPGSATLFCSYCFASGISTEKCPCNGVKTKNLRGPRVVNIKERLGKKINPKAGPSNRSGSDKKPDPRKDPFPCAFSLQIGAQFCGAYVKEYNGISDLVRTHVIIQGIKREMTFEIDLNMT